MPFTRSDRAESVLLDIQENIVLALQFVAGIIYEQFISDRKTLYAVMRCLEIISEASRKLPDEIKERHPMIPRRKIAGAGNIYRHEYGQIGELIVWETVHHNLESLGLVVESELSALRS
jgi:uncharacterized protein with HEPN domain